MFASLLIFQITCILRAHFLDISRFWYSQKSFSPLEEGGTLNFVANEISHMHHEKFNQNIWLFQLILLEIFRDFQAIFQRIAWNATYWLI